MKKRIAIAVIALLLAIVAIPVVQNTIRYRMNPLAALLVPLLDGTKWSPNYSYWKFHKIKPGMTTNEVIGLLGPCLVQTTYEERTYWHYTTGLDGYPMSSSSYSTHQRIIVFNHDGKVEDKIFDFYVD